MYRCENWTIKKAEHQIIHVFEVVLEKTLESALDCKKIKPVNPKGDQSGSVFGRIDDGDEALLLWAPDAKN